MKKPALFLAMFLSIVILLITGCSADKQAASGLPKDSMNTAASNVGETKSTGNSFSSENSSKLVEPVKTDVPKTTDKTQSQENAPQKIAAHTTTGEAGHSLPTPASQVPLAIQSDNTDKKAVTIAINCSTAVAKGLDKQAKFKAVVPADGIILPPTKVEFKDGETVFDALKAIVRANQIQLQYEGSQETPYIKGINNLYEFDGGPLSGWMYSVNKLYANYGCNKTKLKNGDAIEWNYTCNLGKDLGQK
ncbi:MAG: DUF4430 domain-containing protein [Desulfosporosinus sp.]